MVDGVVASVYSDWFLDPLLAHTLLMPHLPAIYHAILWPARLMYHWIGRTAARRFDEEVLTPSLMDPSQHGVKGFLSLLGQAMRHTAHHVWIHKDDTALLI